MLSVMTRERIVWQGSKLPTSSVTKVALLDCLDA